MEIYAIDTKRDIAIPSVGGQRRRFKLFATTKQLETGFDESGMQLIAANIFGYVWVLGLAEGFSCSLPYVFYPAK